MRRLWLLPLITLGACGPVRSKFVCHVGTPTQDITLYFQPVTQAEAITQATKARNGLVKDGLLPEDATVHCTKQDWDEKAMPEGTPE